MSSSSVIPLLRRLGLLALLVALGFAAPGCSGHGCRHIDWCACSNGNECDQSCVDTDGCSFFCDHMVKCGGTCGKGCNFTFHDATNNTADCGDNCTIDCYDSTSCAATCGAKCNYNCFNVDSCSVQAGAGSVITCDTFTTCAVTCLGPCNVSCSSQTAACDVTCPDGAAPMSCVDGSLACGSC